MEIHLEIDRGKGKRTCKEEEAKPIQDNSKISKKEQLKGKDKRRKRKKRKRKKEKKYYKIQIHSNR